MGLSIGSSLAAHVLAREAFANGVEHQHLDETPTDLQQTPTPASQYNPKEISIDKLATTLESTIGDLLVRRLAGMGEMGESAGGTLSNFAIQDLMSRYNQAETLASNVQKKSQDASNANIQKIG